MRFWRHRTVDSANYSIFRGSVQTPRAFVTPQLNKVRRLKDVRARYAATGEKAVLAGVPEEDCEFVTGIWPPEFERILNGESASMLAQDAQLGKL